MEEHYAFDQEWEDKGTKYRHWVFTYFPRTNDCEKWMDQTLTNKGTKYGCYGMERCPTSGLWHFQGFVSYDNPRSFSGTKKTFRDAHLEPAFTVDRAIQYCMKGDQPKGEWKEHGPEGENWGKDLRFKEFGTKPENEQGRRTDIESMKALILERKLPWCEIALLTNPSNIKWAEHLYRLYPMIRVKAPRVYWFWGPSGSGKTRKAHDMCPEAWLSSGELTYWNGYKEETEVILDDLRKTDIRINGLLRVLDRYKYTVNVKGSHFPLQATTIVVTSCYSPEEFCAGSSENPYQLRRRIEESGGCVERFGTGTEVQGNTNTWTYGNTVQISKTSMIPITQIPDLYN